LPQAVTNISQRPLFACVGPQIAVPLVSDRFPHSADSPPWESLWLIFRKIRPVGAMRLTCEFNSRSTGLQSSKQSALVFKLHLNVLFHNNYSPHTPFGTFTKIVHAPSIVSFNANRCWIRNVKNMSKNKFWCRN